MPAKNKICKKGCYYYDSFCSFHYINTGITWSIGRTWTGIPGIYVVSVAPFIGSQENAALKRCVLKLIRGTLAHDVYGKYIFRQVD
ncbi:hypothetical protein WN943_026152 [Citrus x changshan-huyou]